MQERESHRPVDLTNCDTEPIHIPGSVQPYGILLACDPDLTTIELYSDNAPRYLEASDETLAGRLLADVLTPECVHDLRNALTRSKSPSKPGIILGADLGRGEGCHDIVVHVHDGRAILEIERAKGDREDSVLETARFMIDRLEYFETAQLLLQAAVRALHRMLEYDRVMAYRFADDGAGQVVAEVKAPKLESFLGQWFPASDIPQQARQLYLKNRIRVVSDASGKRAAILPAEDEMARPLDLSFAHLRSVSPIHLEYLRNMGVSASMSISLVVNGALWGLIACHHYAPKSLSLSKRLAAEMLSEFLSLHLSNLRNTEKLSVTSQARAALDQILRGARKDESVKSVLHAKLDAVMDLIPCDGVGMWIDGTWTAKGSCAPREFIGALVEHINNHSQSRIWSTPALGKELPLATAYADQACGVLAIPLSQIPRDYLLFFRREVVQTIEWAGDPNKTYTSGPLGDRLTPRRSFALWKETVRGRSYAWMKEDLETAEAARVALFELIMQFSEMMAAERRKAELRQRIVNEELNHRVKNILALIKTLVTQSSDSSEDLAAFVPKVTGRIHALAMAHDQLSRGKGSRRLAKLVHTELLPYQGVSARINIHGDPIVLDERAFSAMALVVHELATNAVKYGALSHPDGVLDVRWTLLGDGSCEFVWKEFGHPMPDDPYPPRKGFGSTLIHRTIPFELGGTANVELTRTGAVGRFVLPAACVSAAEDEGHEPAGLPMEPPAPCTPTLEGTHVLSLEDQLVIALDVEGTLTRSGAVVTTAASAAEALSRIAHEPPHVAVLDVNLGSGTCSPVAKELARRNIPFLFATGYGDAALLPPEFRDVPVLRKPIDGGRLVTALSQLLTPET